MRGARAPACAVLVLVCVAACGGSGNPAKPALGTVSVARGGASGSVVFPQTIGPYSATGKATPNAGFATVFPAAAAVEVGTYAELGSSGVATSSIIVVNAGRLKPGVNPARALDSYVAAGSRAGRAVDIRTVPAGPAGGQARCWLAPDGGGLTSAFCMWADSSTFGWLAAGPHKGKNSTRTLARLMLTFRSAMEF
jgi:hypothetical protein